MEETINLMRGLKTMLHPRHGMGFSESVLSIIVIGTVCYLVIMGKEVPGWLIGIATAGGFWLGSQARTYSRETE